MCNNFPNIRITEGNNFSIRLPLRSRTYVSTKPIDEDIDPELLENVVVTFGGVEYPSQKTAQGVQIDLPSTLTVGTYNIVLTADYYDSEIRAAYESAVTIVPWSAQSTAEQYIVGSPIILRAAYVLSGAMTDAELETLKEEFREKNVQLEQAIANAEAAKLEWEEKAANLNGIARELTSRIINSKIGNPAQGQPLTLFDAIGNVDLSAQTLQSLADSWSAMVEQRNIIDGYEFSQGFNVESVSNILFNCSSIQRITDNVITRITASFYDIRRFMRFSYFRADNVTYLPQGSFQELTSLREVYLANIKKITTIKNFEGCTQLRILYMPKLESFSAQNFSNTIRLIDLTIGSAYQNISLNTWNPTEALLSNSISLLTAEDIEDGFSNNLEKLLYNIREHIAARITDLTGSAGATITFHSNVKAAIMADQSSADAFTNKNWTIA